MTPMINDGRATLLRTTLVAVALTTGADFVYFTVWELFLFPEGSVLGKLVWSLACSIVMGLAIGTLTYLWVEQNVLAKKQFWVPRSLWLRWAVTAPGTAAGLMLGPGISAATRMLRCSSSAGLFRPSLGVCFWVGWLAYGRGRSYGNEDV